MSRLGLAGIVDGSLAFAALDAAHRASGRGSVFRRRGVEAPTGGQAAVVMPSRELPNAEQTRDRRDGLVAAVLWLTVMACADTSAGRTPGRAVAGIRLERRDGEPMTLARLTIRHWTPTARRLGVRALWRHLPPEIRRFVPLASLGVAFAVLAVQTGDGERRSMGDWVAGTRLVQG